MKYPRITSVLMLMLFAMTANAQLMTRYTVKAGKYPRHNTIISIPGEAKRGDVYLLYRVHGSTKTLVSVQVSNGRFR